MDFFKNLFNPNKKEVYSIKTNSFNFKKDNEFWHSIGFAHKNGINGRGIKAAILDIGFDLSYPSLQKQTKLHRQYHLQKNSVTHGNTVALLVLEVAPQVELHLFDIGKNGSPNPDFIDLAIEEITQIGMNIVNLSWGKKVPKKVHTATELAIENCNCYVCSKIKPLAQHTLVVTSVGNDANFQYCPSTVPNVYNAGFQSESVTVKKTLDGGKAYLAGAIHPKTFSQSLNTHFTIMQPDNLTGSSFASPLFAGFLALMENPKNDLLKYLSAAEYNARAASLVLTAEKNKTILTDYEAIENHFLNGIRCNPHGILCDKNDFCLECSTFTLDGYQNLALLYLNTNQFPLAKKLALHAITIAPFSAHAYATLATIYREQVRKEIKIKVLSKTILVEKLKSAIINYEKAIERKPDYVEVYRDGIDTCNVIMEQLKQH